MARRLRLTEPPENLSLKGVDSVNSDSRGTGHLLAR